MAVPHFSIQVHIGMECLVTLDFPIPLILSTTPGPSVVHPQGEDLFAEEEEVVVVVVGGIVPLDREPHGTLMMGQLNTTNHILDTLEKG